jgi:hypothetical protein
MTKIINLTPHPLHLTNAAGEVTIIAPAPGPGPRVDHLPGKQVEFSVFEGICAEFTGDTAGEVIDMPEPQPDTVFIVSGMVGDCLDRHSRPDVFVPGTAPKDLPVRNETGHIVAVTRVKQLRRKF